MRGKYRHRPIRVIAYQVTMDILRNPEKFDIPNHFESNPEACVNSFRLWVGTDENGLDTYAAVLENDWVVESEGGDITVCTPSEFKRLYEAVE